MIGSRITSLASGDMSFVNLGIDGTASAGLAFPEMPWVAVRSLLGAAVVVQSEIVVDDSSALTDPELDRNRAGTFCTATAPFTIAIPELELG